MDYLLKSNLTRHRVYTSWRGQWDSDNLAWLCLQSWRYLKMTAFSVRKNLSFPYFTYKETGSGSTEVFTYLRFYYLRWGQRFSNLCFNFLSIVPLASECLLGVLGYLWGVGERRKDDRKGSGSLSSVWIFLLYLFWNKEASTFIHN